MRSEGHEMVDLFRTTGNEAKSRVSEVRDILELLNVMYLTKVQILETFQFNGESQGLRLVFFPFQSLRWVS